MADRHNFFSVSFVWFGNPCNTFDVFVHNIANHRSIDQGRCCGCIACRPRICFVWVIAKQNECSKIYGCVEAGGAGAVIRVFFRWQRLSVLPIPDEVSTNAFVSVIAQKGEDNRREGFRRSDVVFLHDKPCRLVAYFSNLIPEFFVAQDFRRRLCSIQTELSPIDVDDKISHVQQRDVVRALVNHYGVAGIARGQQHRRSPSVASTVTIAAITLLIAQCPGAIREVEWKAGRCPGYAVNAIITVFDDRPIGIVFVRIAIFVLLIVFHYDFFYGDLRYDYFAGVDIVNPDRLLVLLVVDPISVVDIDVHRRYRIIRRFDQSFFDRVGTNTRTDVPAIHVI
mmetsp:Transcript_22865/g.48638  ORF Transcript_22865/g.48638 Transcript_22865/m.48638 type:complete len:339 (-) Transcript_22865:802-1818(-)